MSTAQQIFLSTVEADVLSAHLGLGRMPYPLTVPSFGFRTDERARVIEGAWESLAGKGLSRGTQLDEDLEHIFRLLARPSVSVDSVGDIGDPLRALAVRDGDSAAAAMLTPEGLYLMEIRPTAMASTLVEVLPHAEPGPGHAFNFPHRALQAAIAEEEGDDDMFFGGGEHDSLVRAGMSAGDARLLGELVENRVRGGQFGVTTRNRSRGDSVRSATLVTWFDTDAGRYLVVREQEWVSVTPAGADRIAARIDQTLATAVGDR
jgi:hypothetical protein